jgi:hypothetical protein
MITVFPIITQNNHKSKKDVSTSKKIKFKINSLKTIKFEMNKKYTIRRQICQT